MVDEFTPSELFQADEVADPVLGNPALIVDQSLTWQDATAGPISPSGDVNMTMPGWVTTGGNPDDAAGAGAAGGGGDDQGAGLIRGPSQPIIPPTVGWEEGQTGWTDATDPMNQPSQSGSPGAEGNLPTSDRGGASVDVSTEAGDTGTGTVATGPTWDSVTGSWKAIIKLPGMDGWGTGQTPGTNGQPSGSVGSRPAGNQGSVWSTITSGAQKVGNAVGGFIGRMLGHTDSPSGTTPKGPGGLPGLGRVGAWGAKAPTTKTQNPISMSYIMLIVGVILLYVLLVRQHHVRGA